MSFALGTIYPTGSGDQQGQNAREVDEWHRDP